MELSFGQRISGLTVDGAELRAAVFDENQVRAAAGLTMVLGAVAFSLAYFEHAVHPAAGSSRRCSSSSSSPGSRSASGTARSAWSRAS